MKQYPFCSANSQSLYIYTLVSAQPIRPLMGTICTHTPPLGRARKKTKRIKESRAEEGGRRRCRSREEAVPAPTISPALDPISAYASRAAGGWPRSFDRARPGGVESRRNKSVYRVGQRDCASGGGSLCAPCPAVYSGGSRCLARCYGELFIPEVVFFFFMGDRGWFSDRRALLVLFLNGE